MRRIFFRLPAQSFSGRVRPTGSRSKYSGSRIKEGRRAGAPARRSPPPRGRPQFQREGGDFQSALSLASLRPGFPGGRDCLARRREFFRAGGVAGDGDCGRAGGHVRPPHDWRALHGVRRHRAGGLLAAGAGGGRRDSVGRSFVGPTRFSARPPRLHATPDTPHSSPKIAPTLPAAIASSCVVSAKTAARSPAFAVPTLEPPCLRHRPLNPSFPRLNRSIPLR